MTAALIFRLSTQTCSYVASGNAVGATSLADLDQRIDRLKGEYGTVAVHRPLGAQLELFCEHFPGQTIKVPDYADYQEKTTREIPLAILEPA